MTARDKIRRLLQQEDINFLLTNRIPRRFLTHFFGWFSRIEQPLVRDVSLAAWRLFGDLDLGEAKSRRFRSLHDCFVRELKDGARPITAAADILVSPCDAIVGACGVVEETRLFQAKGFPYSLQDLLCDAELVRAHRNGCYATLRLTSSMYHRFHAPHDGRIERVIHISGDTWNVNPIALRRIERLFCRNERATLQMRISAGDAPITLVAVGAILVAGIRLHCVGDVPLRDRSSRSEFVRNSEVRKGEELGWFEHGSTILVFAPERFALCDNVREGATIRMGEPLMRLP